MRLARKGFTLIELIVVIVVIGIIAAIAIAKFVGVKEAAYVASMKSDLRNFALYEQFYATDNGGSYFSGDVIAEGFKPTTDVTVLASGIPGPPPNWSATATHSKTLKSCTIGVSDPSSWTIVCP
jgi:prepilin-type N-terminal cleavage/methylation domain-containing protein